MRAVKAELIVDADQFVFTFFVSSLFLSSLLIFVQWKSLKCANDTKYVIVTRIVIGLGDPA